MPVTINASNSAGIGITSDTSGVIQFQSNGANTVNIAANGTMTNASGTFALTSQIPPATANLTTYTSGSGTWTKPSSGTFCLVRLWGAGGSGSRNTSTAQACGGGGGAYMDRYYRLADLGATESYSVGAGGAAVAVTGSGNPGGNSTFGSGTGYAGTLVTAYGGAAGTNSAGGNGGGYTATNITGSGDLYTGGAGSTVAGNTAVRGGGGGGGAAVGAGSAGGSSLYGGSGGAGAAGVATAGTTPSGGGGAATNSGTSGAGGNGRIEVWVW